MLGPGIWDRGQMTEDTDKCMALTNCASRLRGMRGAPFDDVPNYLLDNIEASQGLGTFISIKFHFGHHRAGMSLMLLGFFPSGPGRPWRDLLSAIIYITLF